MDDRLISLNLFFVKLILIPQPISPLRGAVY